jgi:hypothetical protein
MVDPPVITAVPPVSPKDYPPITISRKWKISVSLSVIIAPRLSSASLTMTGKPGTTTGVNNTVRRQ